MAPSLARWLAMAHEVLDAAVAAAYGWPADLPDDEVLERLFALNQERAAAGSWLSAPLLRSTVWCQGAPAVGGPPTLAVAPADC